MKIITLFEEFGVSEAATEAEIKTKYRHWMRALHPDANGGVSADENKLKRLIKIYHLLINPETRVQYRQKLAQRRAQQAAGYYHYSGETGQQNQQQAYRPTFQTNNDSSFERAFNSGRWAIPVVIWGLYMLLKLFLQNDDHLRRPLDYRNLPYGKTSLDIYPVVDTTSPLDSGVRARLNPIKNPGQY